MKKFCIRLGLVLISIFVGLGIGIGVGMATDNTLLRLIGVVLGFCLFAIVLLFFAKKYEFLAVRPTDQEDSGVMIWIPILIGIFVMHSCGQEDQSRRLSQKIDSLEQKIDNLQRRLEKK
jgi:hypothetical protein